MNLAARAMVEESITWSLELSYHVRRRCRKACRSATHRPWSKQPCLIVFGWTAACTTPIMLPRRPASASKAETGGSIGAEKSVEHHDGHRPNKHTRAAQCAGGGFRWQQIVKVKHGGQAGGVRSVSTNGCIASCISTMSQRRDPGAAVASGTKQEKPGCAAAAIYQFDIASGRALLLLIIPIARRMTFPTAR
jgi:hypothetical protein